MKASDAKMKWVSAITEARSAQDAVDDLARGIGATLQGGIDLAFLFVSPYFQNDYDQLSGRIFDRLGCRTLIGCSAGGVIGGEREIERRPAISILAASLPDVVVNPFHIDQADLPDLDASPTKWEACFGIQTTGRSHFVLLADPVTMDVERALQGLDYAYPHSAKIGGLSSGGEGAGKSGLFLNQERFRSGMVGIGISGEIEMDTIVAQGCKPIGEPFSITKSDRNLLIEIDHKQPIEVLQDLFQELSEADQKRIQHSLFIGLATTPLQESLSRGDFLMRNLMGLDPRNGALALSALPHEGQTGQFHLRDQETSAEEMKWYLTEYQLATQPKTAMGALLFSCMGRGSHLYGEPDFETRLFHAQMGLVPLGGFFCNGEIGRVAQTTFLHGYTSCLGLFRRPSSTNLS